MLRGTCRKNVLTFIICNNKCYFNTDWNHILDINIYWKGEDLIYFAYILVYCLWHCCTVNKTTYYNIYVNLISINGWCNCLQKKYREMFKLGAQKVGYRTLDHLCTPLRDLLMLSITLRCEVRKVSSCFGSLVSVLFSSVFSVFVLNI